MYSFTLSPSNFLLIISSPLHLILSFLFTFPLVLIHPKQSSIFSYSISSLSSFSLSVSLSLSLLINLFSSLPFPSFYPSSFIPSLFQISPFLFHLPSIKSPPAYFISLLSNPSLLISSLLLQISPFFPASFKFLHFSFIPLHSNIFLILSSSCYFLPFLQISPFLFHLSSFKSLPFFPPLPNFFIFLLYVSSF